MQDFKNIYYLLLVNQSYSKSVCIFDFVHTGVYTDSITKKHHNKTSQSEQGMKSPKIMLIRVNEEL